MYTYVFFVISLLLLAACSPNTPKTDQTESGTIISAEQQKRDSSAKLQAENELLDEAKVELNQAESIIAQETELKLTQDEQNEKMLLDLAKRKERKAEQDLLEKANSEASKAATLLDQAASSKKDLPNPTL